MMQITQVFLEGESLTLKTSVKDLSLWLGNEEKFAFQNLKNACFIIL